MLYRKLVFPALCAYSPSDPEEAHELLIHFVQFLRRHPWLFALIRTYYRALENPSPVEVAGVTFPNRIGMAAGFDKQGWLLELLQELGFGFVEVGTVTPKPQRGNDRPRIARFRKEKMLWNRMGFNSVGAVEVASRLAEARPRIRIPIGGSLGKQVDTPNENALADYQFALEQLAPFVDYLVANVSSPNTKNLRDLQAFDELASLTRGLVSYERARAERNGTKVRPLFLKFAPDLRYRELEAMLDAGERNGASGFIIGNTTVRPLNGFRPAGMFANPDQKPGEPLLPWGGYSGPLLKDRVQDLIKYAARRTKLPLIACGGVESGEDAARLLDCRASLVQLYTGFIYQGPALVWKCRRATT